MTLPRMASTLGLASLVASLSLSSCSDDMGGSDEAAGGQGGLSGLDTGDGPPEPDLPVVAPVAETDAVNGFGDAADDPAIWVHPTDPEKSLIFGTDKTPSGGLFVYELDGTTREFLALGELNNIDLRDGFTLGDREVTLITATNRTTDSLTILALDVETLEIEDVAAGVVPTLPQSYGTCMYKSETGAFYVFVNTEDGRYGQFELVADGETVTAKPVREFCLETQPEGCVVDDQAGRLFAGEEGFGVWSFAAEADGPPSGDELPNCEGAIPGKQIANTFDGVLTKDVEGMSIYADGDDAGYLIVSAQGAHEFVVFDRIPPHDPILTFAVWGGGDSCIDGVEETDGLDVTSRAVGTAYPDGLLVVQDGFNGDPVDKQNFKFVSMTDVLAQLAEPEVPFEHNLACNLGDYGGKPRYADLPPGPERTETFCVEWCDKCTACYAEGDPGFSESDCHYKSGKPNYLEDDCLAGCAAGFAPADTGPLSPGWQDWDCLDVDEAL